MVKIDRTPTPPASLARRSKYNDIDVVDQLIFDSGNKCYICEMNPSDPEVEHLLPHKNGELIERKYDWNNLFYTCRHCNIMKNKSKYDENILNCCDENPEEFIDHILDDKHVIVKPHDPEETNDIIILTAELIQSCFESEKPPLRKAAAQQRFRKLSNTMNIMYKMLLDINEQNDTDEVFQALKEMLNRKSEFAAFVRFYVRCHSEEYPELQDAANS